jgi:DNA-binding HxlR family transcriptional regulator
MEAPQELRGVLVKVSELLRSPSIDILKELAVKGEMRHRQLEKLVGSRGSLSENLNDLLSEGLVKRKVIPTQPIQTKYSLTEKGREVARRLTELQSLLS